MQVSESIVNSAVELQRLFPFQQESLCQIDVKQLHLWLEIETRVDIWFFRRVEDFGFLEGVDFTGVIKNDHSRKINGLKCSVSMAKELSMLERSEKGRQIRRYFIACERAAIETIPVLRERIQALEVQKGILQIEAKKKPHPYAGTVLTYNVKPTLFQGFDASDAKSAYDTRRIPRDALTEPEIATHERIHCGIRLSGTSKEMQKRQAFEAALHCWSVLPSHIRAVSRKPQRKDFGLRQ